MSALPLPTNDIGVCACGCGIPFYRAPKGRFQRLYVKNHRHRVYKREREARQAGQGKSNLNQKAPDVVEHDFSDIDMHKLAIALVADAWRNRKRYPNAKEFLLAEDEDNKVMLAFWCHVADLSLSKVVERARKEFGE